MPGSTELILVSSNMERAAAPAAIGVTTTLTLDSTEKNPLSTDAEEKAKIKRARRISLIGSGLAALIMPIWTPVWVPAILLPWFLLMEGKQYNENPPVLPPEHNAEPISLPVSNVQQPTPVSNTGPITSPVSNVSQTTHLRKKISRFPWKFISTVRDDPAFVITQPGEWQNWPVIAVAIKRSFQLNTIIEAIDKLVESSINIDDIKDPHQNTLLHIAIKVGATAVAKRLLQAGANYQFKNAENKSAIQLAIEKQNEELCAIFYFLDPKEFDGKNCPYFLKINLAITKRINKRREVIVYLNQQVTGRSLEDVLASVTSGNNALYTKEMLEVSYRNICQQDKVLIPLLEIARFAALGYSRTYKNGNTLKIFIDHEKSEVDLLANPRGTDRQGRVVGRYRHRESIHVAGLRGNINLVRGTLLHELTHFVALEVYKNNCNPYFEDDDEKFDQWEKMTEELDNRQAELHECLRIVFDIGRYDKKDRHKELIVRVPQLLAIGEKHTLETQCPELFQYYKETFLVDCEKHLKELRIKSVIVEDRKECDKAVFDQDLSFEENKEEKLSGRQELNSQTSPQEASKKRKAPVEKSEAVKKQKGPSNFWPNVSNVNSNQSREEGYPLRNRIHNG